MHYQLFAAGKPVTVYQSPCRPYDIKTYSGEIYKHIADEMALELGFEGYRYGDLIRIAMHRAEPGTYADNEYLASRVANRTSEYNGELYDKLYGDGSSYNRNWYLPLP